MIGRIFFGLIFCALAAAVYSQAPVTATSAQSPYETIALKLKGGDTKIDFRALRIAYSESKDAVAAGSSHLTRRAMNVELMNRRYDEVIRIAGDILKTVYISPDTHAALSVAYREQGNTQKADLHKAIYLGLVNSIISTGDGKSQQTAYHVVTTEEEYAVMRALGLSVWRQEITNVGSQWYETLFATNTKTNQTEKVWFNITIPRNIQARTTQVAKP